MGKYGWERVSGQRSNQKRGEREKRDIGRGKGKEGGRERLREIERFFIFARDAYLMIFSQTDRQTQRETHRTHLRV